MPDQSTLSRRLRRRQTRLMLDLLLILLDDASVEGAHPLVKRLDGKPLPVSRHSTDPGATFGRGAGGKNRGYKLHAIYGKTSRPVAMRVTGLGIDERAVATDLIAELSDPGYLLADAFYDTNKLHDLAAAGGHRLVTPRRFRGCRPVRRDRGSRRRVETIDRLAEPDPFLRRLLSTRRQIETRFANLCNFGGGLITLPPWTRRHRVEPFVKGKLVVRLCRDRLNQQASRA